MSKIVLCETKPAKVPYKIAKIGRSFQSYEEFCWLLEHYLIFFLTEGFEYPLKNYLKEQLDIVIKSDDVVQQVKEVINYYNYFTSVSAKITHNLSLFCCKEAKTSGRYVFKASIVCKSIDCLPET